MKHLSQFNQFDLSRFLNGKSLAVVECTPWQERGTGKLLGTAVDTVVLVDNTNYGEGKSGTNKYEKLRLKVSQKQLTIPADKIVEPVNAVARVYGEYNNQLSVTCDDVKIVEPKAAK